VAGVKQKNTKPKKIEAGKHEMDYTFMFLIILLACCGLVMLLSASTPAANTKMNNSYYFFIRQLLYVLIGIVGMLVVSNIKYTVYKKLAVPIMGICFILLVLVAIPGIGKEFNGSRRWLGTESFQVQPSEFMKPAIAIFFAFMLDHEKKDMRYFKSNIKYIAIIGVLFILMMMEPHLSGGIVIAGIGIVLLIIVGFRIKPLVMLGILFGPFLLTFLYFFDEVRWARITSFIDPFHDLQGKSYQIAQSLYSIGSGGIFGKGLGESMQKYSFLPEPYNDFIFAVICEELGLIGATAIIILFALFIYHGIKISLHAPDKFSMLVSAGIVSQITIQTVLNIAVATSSVPCTGVSLPFFSYGGTSLCILLSELGILLNISKYTTNHEKVFSYFTSNEKTKKIKPKKIKKELKG